MALHLIMGPMFSGKTSLLNQKLKEARLARRSVLFITPESDTRYSHETHDRSLIGDVGRTAQKTLGSLRWERRSRLAETCEASEPEQDIFIDEGHFFKDLPTVVRRYLHENKNVTIALLNGTCEQEPFQVVSEIIPLVTKLDFCTAICCDQRPGCRTIAPFIQYVGAKPACHCGGAETYKSCCWSCVTKT